MATFLRDDSDLSVLTGVASTTVGSIRLTGTTIGLESDTDLMTLGSSLLDVNAANIDFNGSILKFRDVSSDAATITLTQSTGIIECTGMTTTSDVTYGGDLSVDGDLSVEGIISGDFGVMTASSITSSTITTTGNATIGGDLTITGGRITFGNGEIIHNESDTNIIMTAISSLDLFASSEDCRIILRAGDTTKDAGLLIYPTTGLGSPAWSLCNDGTGDTFKIDAGTATVGGATKLSLTQTGNMAIAGDLTVEGNDIKDDDGTTCITFDSSGNTTIANTLNATVTGNVTGNATTASVATEATNSTIVANDSTDETVYPTFVDGATGTQGLETDTGLTYNPSTGVLTSLTFTGALVGNAATASTATEATNVTIVANNTADETVYPAFVDGATGTQGLETDTGLTYNPNSGVLTSTNFTGALTGNADTATSSSSSTLATNCTIVANNTADETVYPIFVDGATGTQGLETDTGLTYNPSSGVLTSTTFTGALSGNSTTSTESTNVTVSANNTADETVYPVFVDGATGTQGIETDTGLTYNPNTGTLTSSVFSGNVTGDLTGTADDADKVNLTANDSTDETVYLTFADGQTGAEALETDVGLQYNPSTGTITTGFFTGSGAYLTSLPWSYGDDLTQLNSISPSGVWEIDGGSTQTYSTDVNIKIKHGTDSTEGLKLYSGRTQAEPYAWFNDYGNGGRVRLYEGLSYGADDYCQIEIAQHGATTISTLDAAAAAAHLTLNPDGNLQLKPATYTYSEVPIGFTQATVTENATDTVVTFNLSGNKQFLTLTGNVTDVHFRFPTVSGNFTCVILQDGTGGRTVSNWKSNDSDGTERTLKWAGGATPENTETANKADIVSFYWDAPAKIAYGVYTYNF